MNDWSEHLQAAARDLQGLALASGLAQAGGVHGGWSARCERAASLSSGLAVENEILELAREINESGVVKLDEVPALRQALEGIRLRWNRAGRCCRR